VSLFQDPLGFRTSSWKTGKKPGFSVKAKEASQAKFVKLQVKKA
jgi:hypothetical protein